MLTGVPVFYLWKPALEKEPISTTVTKDKIEPPIETEPSVEEVAETVEATSEEVAVEEKTKTKETQKRYGIKL